MIPISKDILKIASKSVQLNELHAFCVYGVIGFYALFISYLRYICDKTNLATAVRKSGEELIVKSKMYDFISVTRTT